MIRIKGGANNNNYANVDLILNIAKRYKVEGTSNANKRYYNLAQLHFIISVIDVCCIICKFHFDFLQLFGLAGDTHQKTQNSLSYCTKMV